MVKKIRLDFSKVEERSGWNTKHISEGLHRMKIESVQETEAQDGVAMLIYALVPTESKLKTRRFPFYCKLQQNQLWKIRDLLVAAGETVPKKATQIDPSKVVGKCIAAEVEDDTYQGNVRSSVNGTYGLDILDDDGPDNSADDGEAEDEEEYEEWEDEESEDDLDEMSIADLRTLAKSLSINTVKKSKVDLIDDITDAQADAEEDESEEDLDEEEEDFDEDDLDEEDLEDEDDEDEFDDEEEEPAPKRKAPANKPAPKAAPAKRTVQRRR